MGTTWGTIPAAVINFIGGPPHCGPGSQSSLRVVLNVSDRIPNKRFRVLATLMQICIALADLHSTQLVRD
jgi:hypothetical protein